MPTYYLYDSRTHTRTRYSVEAADRWTAEDIAKAHGMREPVLLPGNDWNPKWGPVPEPVTTRVAPLIGYATLTYDWTNGDVTVRVWVGRTWVEEGYRSAVDLRRAAYRLVRDTGWDDRTQRAARKLIRESIAADYANLDVTYTA